MKDKPPKIITIHELKHPTLRDYNLDKGDIINILRHQNRYGVPAAKKELEFLLKQKAIEAKLDFKIRRENAKLEFEIEKQKVEIENKRAEIKQKENQKVRDSLLRLEKEKNSCTTKLANNNRKILADKAKNDRLTITDPIKQKEKTSRTKYRAENADKIGAGIREVITGVGKGAGAVLGGIAGGIAGNPFGVAQSALDLAKYGVDINKAKIPAANQLKDAVDIIKPKIAAAKELKALTRPTGYNIKDITNPINPPKSTPTNRMQKDKNHHQKNAKQ